MEEKHEKVEKPRDGSPPRGASRRKSKTSKRFPFELKVKAVKLYLEEGFSGRLVAQETGASQQALSGWVRIYQELGEEGLKSHTPASLREPKLPAPVTARIVELKKQNPSFGVKRISQWLRRVLFLRASPETVRQKLHQAGLMEPAPKRKERNITRPRFFERATPNQMWQSDIFTFRLGGRYAYLVAFLDDYSRFMVGADLFRSPTAEAVIEVYRQAVAEYKPPKEMLTDNGRQYTSWRGTSRFEAELKKDGVAHFKSRPQHPMTLGKIERFWSSIWQDFLTRAQFESFDSARERIKFWIKHYNHKRPHQGIDGLCPADRFFEIQSELRKTIEAGIKDNILEMALRGQPRAPFYMVGRMEGQSVVLRAEKGKLKLELSDRQNQTTQELTYELNKPEGENAAAQTAQLHPLQLQRPGESPGGAGGLDGTGQPGGDLPAAEHQLGDLPTMATSGHGGDAPGPDQSCQPGPGRSVECAPAESLVQTSTGVSGGQSLQPAGTSAEQDCQCPGESGTKALDGHASTAQGAGASHGDHASALRPIDGEGSGANIGSLAQDLLSMGATRPGGDAGPIGGPATGPATETERSGKGSTGETTSAGPQRVGGGPASQGTAGDPGHPPSNPR